MVRSSSLLSRERQRHSRRVGCDDRGLRGRLEVKRLEVWLVNLDPTIGSEIQKTRPAIIVSPDELNAHLNTVILVPLTTGRSYPFRVPTKVQGKSGTAAIDQIRTVDKRRLVKRLSVLRKETADALLAALVEMFTP